MGTNEQRPMIAVTSEVEPGRLVASRAVIAAVAAAGGVPICVGPPGVGGGANPAGASAEERAAVERIAEAADGWVFTGGDDPHMEPFGASTDPRVDPVAPERQRFELLALAAAEARGQPALGLCLGMQLMCLRAGGTLDQWLADRGEAVARRHHPGNRRAEAEAGDAPADVRHMVRVEGDGPLGRVRETEIPSRHRQAIVDAGSMEVLARAEDGVIEAVVAGGFLGVQWHAERLGAGELGAGVFGWLVARAAGRVASG